MIKFDLGTSILFKKCIGIYHICINILSIYTVLNIFNVIEKFAKKLYKTY